MYHCGSREPRQPHAKLVAVVPELNAAGHGRPPPIADRPCESHPQGQHDRVERHHEHRQEQIAPVQAGEQHGIGRIARRIVHRHLPADGVLRHDLHGVAVTRRRLAIAKAIGCVFLIGDLIGVRDFRRGCCSSARPAAGDDPAIGHDAVGRRITERGELSIDARCPHHIEHERDRRPAQSEAEQKHQRRRF